MIERKQRSKFIAHAGETNKGTNFQLPASTLNRILSGGPHTSARAGRSLCLLGPRLTSSISAFAALTNETELSRGKTRQEMIPTSFVPDIGYLVPCAVW